MVGGRGETELPWIGTLLSVEILGGIDAGVGTIQQICQSWMADHEIRSGQSHLLIAHLTFPVLYHMLLQIKCRITDLIPILTNKIMRDHGLKEA